MLSVNFVNMAKRIEVQPSPLSLSDLPVPGTGEFQFPLVGMTLLAVFILLVFLKGNLLTDPAYVHTHPRDV